MRTPGFKPENVKMLVIGRNDSIALKSSLASEGKRFNPVQSKDSRTVNKESQEIHN
jgi:hypothetical protein